MEKFAPFDFEGHELEKVALQYEWLETNGLGGWAGSTLAGCNTRRYHALLIAATKPPTERISLVSKIDETVVLLSKNGRPTARYELASNDYGDVMHPTGFRLLSKFSKGIFPQFEYAVEDVILRKMVAMVYRENTTVLTYEIIEASTPVLLELLPLLSGRDYHALIRANQLSFNRAEFYQGVLSVYHSDNSIPAVHIKIPNAEYVPSPEWYYKFHYKVELERGLDSREDLFTPGKLSVTLQKGMSVAVIVSTDDVSLRDGLTLISGERERRMHLIENPSPNRLNQILKLAADQFIVSRRITFPKAPSEEGASIIAGYHWFTDWGRDTMISLPGLCLNTGRHEDARKILTAFASSVSQGMLPNRFGDHGDIPEYNHVDGTLWFFIAIYRFLQQTNDIAFVKRYMIPVLEEILEWHEKGTRHNIHIDHDGLLYAGEKDVQLTWMDAKVEGWVVTPRMGKAVEVNALWYNALCIYAYLLELCGKSEHSYEIREKSQVTRANFVKEFWNEQAGYLYDVIDEVKDDSLRPNQLFAIGLPFPVIEDEKARKILAIVKEHLYTPVGLRTLSSNDPRYQPVYEGNIFQRDGAYHQGTVWSWLLGIYIDAVMRYGGGIPEANKIIEDFVYHLREGGVGSVSEIFDGDAPHRFRGCVAQAWGVGELLRVVSEYDLRGGGGS